MPSNVTIFLPLVAGFIALRILNLTRFQSQTWNGPRLVFWSGVAGIALLFVARFLVIEVVASWKLAIAIQAGIANYFPIPHSGTLGLVFTLSLTLPLAGNVFVRTDRAVWWTRNSGDRLYALLVEETRYGRTIAVTLRDNKMYVGFVLSSPSLRPNEKYFKLLPTLSGYRHAETRRFTITTEYDQVLEALEREDEIMEGLSLEDLQVLLPLDDVTSVRVFDEDVYARIFSASGTSDEGPSAPNTKDSSK